MEDAVVVFYDFCCCCMCICVIYLWICVVFFGCIRFKRSHLFGGPMACCSFFSNDDGKVALEVNCWGFVVYVVGDFDDWLW